MNYAIKKRAAYARPACARGRFDEKHHAASLKKRYPAIKRCDTFLSSLNCRAGAENTVIDSGVYTATFKRGFFTPKFYGFGREGVAYPQGRQHGGIHVFSTFTSIPCARKAHGMVFQSHSGAEPMTNVISLASPRAAHSVQTSAQIPTFKPAPASPALVLEAHTVERQQAIENALSMAPHFIRQPHSAATLQAATGRAIRAASMLKQACTESSTSGRA